MLVSLGYVYDKAGGGGVGGKAKVINSFKKKCIRLLEADILQRCSLSFRLQSHFPPPPPKKERERERERERNVIKEK